MPKPDVPDFDNKTKQGAWKETARQNYADLAYSLSPSSEASSQGKSRADVKVRESKDIVVTAEDGIMKIMFNRPSKKNAITLQRCIRRLYLHLKMPAVVNGPAVGLAVTLLGLFDAVYASDKGMKIPKELMRKNEKQKLHAVNAEESTIIQERLTSEECSNALLKFVSRKAKL